MTTILLHGLATAPSTWDKVCELLPQDQEVWAPQLIMEGSIEDEADRIAAIARAEYGHGTVVGHSMGGLVATALAERHPEVVDRLILVNSPHRVDARLASSGAKESLLATPVLGRAIWRIMPNSAVRSALTTAFTPGFPVPVEFIGPVKATPHHVYLNSNRAIDDYISGKPLHRRLDNLDVPITILFGDLDQRVSPSAALRDYAAVRGARLVRIAGTGHSPQWECPEYVVAALAGSDELDALTDIAAAPTTHEED